MSARTIVIIVPAFNEEKMIESVIGSIPRFILNIPIEVVVIDDGSTDNTYKKAFNSRAVCIRHHLNRGLGAAISTGFMYARRTQAFAMVTFDGDGQHRSKDLEKLLRPIVEGTADVVIGSRLLIPSHMPLSRKIVNVLSNILTFVFFGIWTTDSQSGLRAFSRDAINKIKLRTQRMEVSSEVFKEIHKHKFRTIEVSIPAIYTDYSLQKGQKITNAYDVFWKLFLRVTR